MRKISFSIIAIFISICAFAQIDSLACDSLNHKTNPQYNKQELAIAQMNHHIVSMSRIIRDKSFETLDDELSQLLNNLTIEHIVNFPEIKDLRNELMIKVQELQITAQERNILRRIQELKRQNMIWQSAASALNPTMILTQGGGGNQMAFYALLTIARGAAEYKANAGYQNLEEVQALWELRKSDLEDIKELRAAAFSSTYELYRRLGLKEELRMVEDDADLYADILSEPNPDKALRRMEDNAPLFSHLLDFEYHLGMLHLSVNGYDSAKPHFEAYLTKYANNPIFRRDEKTAYIHLAKLTYETLTKDETDKLINEVMRIIPNNGVASIQCALKYLTDGEKIKAFELLRKAIDNPNISDKNALLMLVANSAPEIKKYPKLWSDIQSSIQSCRGLDLNGFIPYLTCFSKERIIQELDKIIEFKGDTHRDFIFGKKILNKDYEINISTNYAANLSSIQTYYEIKDDDNVSIFQNRLTYSNGIISRDKLLKKVPEFKDSPSLIYNFFTSLCNNEYFCIKEDLDPSKEIYYYPGMESIGSKSSKSIKKIIKRNIKHDYYIIKCKKPTNRVIQAYNLDSIHTKEYWGGWNYIPVIGAVKNYRTVIQRFSESAPQQIDTTQLQISFKGDNLTYIPSTKYQEESNCIRVVINGAVQSIITYIYDHQSDKIIPFSLSTNGHTIMLIDENKLTASNTMPSTEIDSNAEERQENWFKRYWKKIFK